MYLVFSPSEAMQQIKRALTIRARIANHRREEEKKKKCSTQQPFRAVDKPITILVFNFREYFFLRLLFFPFHRFRISIIWFEW